MKQKLLHRNRKSGQPEETAPRIEEKSLIAIHVTRD
jgi:hypothetical protein